MKIFSQSLNYILPVCYLYVIYIYYRIFKNQQRELEGRTVYLLLLLLILHCLSIVFRIMALKMMPLGTIFDAFSFLSFSIVVVYFFIELTIRNKSTGLFILSFAFFFETVAIFHYKWGVQHNEILSHPIFAIHAGMTIMGYTSLSLSAIYALLYIIQDKNMKRKKFSNLAMQLPPVTYLENMSIRSVFIGIMIMGIGLTLGHLQAHYMFGKYWFSDPKVIVTDLIFIFYLVGYITVHIFKLRGRWMAWLSLAGFIILLASAISVVTISHSFHNFY